MRVALITPWDNAWVPYFKKSFESRGHEFTWLKKAVAGNFDIALHGWTTDAPMYTATRNLMFLRRYELFDGGLNRNDWSGVDGLICVNSWIKGVVGGIFKSRNIETPVHLIYNGTDLSKWKFKERHPHYRIGMACHVHPKKNLPLALQILSNLRDEYELHIAGQVQDPCTAEYLNHMGKVLRRRVYIYGHIPSEQMDLWWEQMGYCLSTSLSEGNPNNVIEAMAKGIKPVVHNWPGSKDQFPEYLFGTAEEAAQMITSESYESRKYRDLVQEKFSLNNIERVVDLALNIKEESLA